jgi:hypothetical protein
MSTSFLSQVQFVIYLGSTVARLSSQRIRFYPRLDHVGFWVDKVTFRQDLLRVHQFRPVRIISPILHTHIASIYIRLRIILKAQSMYIWLYVKSRSYNHCWSGNAMSITHSVCVCSLRYQACNIHAPYCHLLPVRFYILCVLIFFTNSVWNVSYCKKNWVRYDQKCTSVFM